MKVAIVYDRINKWGGAERVILSLFKIFPNATLFTSVYNERASWAKKLKIKTSFLQKVPFASSFHEGFALFMPIAFEALDFSEYDLVLSVTSEAAKGIITKPDALHICYCLTPTRYLWSGYEKYFSNPYLKFLSKPAILYLRVWDKIAAQRPDYFISVSNEVKERIKHFYNRDSLTIYPPLTLVDPGEIKPETGEYFLIVSRLVPYKNVEIAIKACNELKLPLKIVGTGSQEYYLKDIAGRTIEFLGELTDDKLRNYYKGCIALIFPGSEDFGLSMIEAQAFGKPVIAYREGGALEIVRTGTGEFFENFNSLKEILANFDVKRYNSENCFKNARRFSYINFKKKLETFIAEKI